MDMAVKVLMLGGVLNILWGLLTGIPISMIRLNQPEYSKYLRLAHLGPLIWGPILLGLAYVIQQVALSKGLELTAAWLMVAGAVLLDAKDIINWRMNITDEFAQKPPIPTLFGGLSALFSLVGTLIIAYGVWICC